MPASYHSRLIPHVAPPRVVSIIFAGAITCVGVEPTTITGHVTAAGLYLYIYLISERSEKLT